jgi:hypothetical protein
MSEQQARAYITRVVKIFNAEQLEPRDKALILALLAQAGACRPGQGRGFTGFEEATRAMEGLASRLSERDQR